MAKIRPLPKDTWYEWYELLISHIPKPVKKYLIFTLFPKDYKPKTIGGNFDEKYTVYNSEGNEQLTIKQYLEDIRSYLQYMVDIL